MTIYMSIHIYVVFDKTPSLCVHPARSSENESLNMEKVLVSQSICLMVIANWRSRFFQHDYIPIA